MDIIVEEAYRESFGKRPTPEEARGLSRTAILHGMEGLIVPAIQRAARFGAASVCSYVDKIIREWKRAGVADEDSLAAYEYERNSR